DSAELMRNVTSDDILEFGLIPELVGRLPMVASLEPLDVPTLKSVLTEPKNALIKQYQTLFEMENAELQFTDEALEAIAQRAMIKGTGARGLRSIIESVMLDIMFDLPEQEPGSNYSITREIVEGREKLFKM